MDEDQLRAAFDATSSSTGQVRVLPGPDEDRDPDGCVVVDGRGDGWSVYVMDRRTKGLREFATKAEALDFAYRRWVLWDEDA